MGAWGLAAVRPVGSLGLLGQPLPPYLFSGRCSNRPLPHLSHTGHEKAVSSSTAITVPRPSERKARLSEWVSVPRFLSVPQHTDN